jgi:hypothetical protein
MTDNASGINDNPITTLLEGVSGRYFEDCNEAEPNQPGIRRGVAAYALDPEKAARLWQVSVETLAGSSSPPVTREHPPPPSPA